MDRRTFLALGTGGAGLFGGCSEMLGTETTRRETDDPSPAETGTDGQKPTFDHVDLVATNDRGEVRYTIRASDTGAITSLEVTSPSESSRRTFDGRKTIETTGTVGAPPGKRSPITVTLENRVGNRNSREQRVYARKYPVLEGKSYDVGAVYHPAFGGDTWEDCIAGSPSVGEYGGPPEDGIVARQIDQAQGFGIDRFIVPSNEIGGFGRVSESPLAHRFELELSYNPREALTGGASLRSQLSAIRREIQTTPTYATRDGRPVVTIGAGAEILTEYDESRGGVYPHSAITSAFDSPEDFVNAVREELRLDDGTPPYLVAKLGVAFRNKTKLTEEFRRFGTEFDAMFDYPSGPGRGFVPWEDAYTMNVKKMLHEWQLAGELSIEFEPVIFPGLNPGVNECRETDTRVPRSPEHFAEMLHLARTFSTTGRIRVDSFNDWPNGTQIEPGRVRDDSYGTAYLDTVRSFQSGDPADRSVYYVSTDGKNSNPGSERKPVRTIQHALLLADPGDTVHVLPGRYHEFVETVRGGKPGRPITITGPPDAVLKSNGQPDPVVMIRHSHVYVTGLTIDGLENPEAPHDVASYNGGGPLVLARPPSTTDAYLEDLVIAPHGIGNTQREMVSIERTRNVEVGPFRVIGPAGTRYLLTDDPGHNGEIVYLGTSPGNLGSNWHPWEEYDRTSDVLVHHIDNSDGHGHSELVQMKSGTHDVTVEYCTDGGGSRNTQDYPSASIRFNSFDGTLRWCDLRNGKGNGVEIGSRIAKEAREEKSDLSEFERRGGTDHAVYGNRITGFDGKAIAFPVESQTQADQDDVCGNVYDGRTDGDPDATCPDSVPEGDGIGHTGGDSPWA